MKRAVLLLVLVVAAQASAQSSRPALPPEKEPGGPGGPTGGPGIDAQWANSPGEVDPFFQNQVYLVDGVPVKVWLRIRADNAIDDVLTFSSGSDTITSNRTTARVVVAAGGSVSVPFELTGRMLSEMGYVSIVGQLNQTKYTDGSAVSLSGNALVMPKVSVGFAKPKAEYVNQGGYLASVPVHVGTRTSVPFVAVAKNHGDTASAAATLTLNAYGRVIKTVTLPALTAGETKEIAVHDFVLSTDMPEYAPVGDGNYYIEIQFQLSPTATDGAYRTYYRYDFANGVVSNAIGDRVAVAFHTGVVAEPYAVNVTLAKPSYIDIAVTNYGDTPARNVRIDVTASPVPAAYYGPGSYVQQTVYVTTGPLETKHVNVSFTPKVAGALQVTVEPYLAGFSQPITRVFDLYTPVTVLPTEELPVLVATRGDTEIVTFTVNSSANLTGAKLGFAVTDPSFYGSGVPYARFITGSDLVSVRATPSTFDLLGNRRTWVNATLDLHSAGIFNLVPYLEVGDVIYVGRVVPISFDAGGGERFAGGSSVGGGGLPGHYELRVQASSFTPATLWLPLAAVSVGYIGYWIWRRRFVL